MTDLPAVVRAAFDRVGSVGVPAPVGRVWLEDGAPFDDLYSGTAGVLLGCAEATSAGLDVVNVAQRALDRLLTFPALPDDGLFSGSAGVAAAVQAWADVTADRAAADGATRMRSELADRITARPDDPGRCTDVISGDAGILLALVDDPACAAAVAVLADGLVALAEPGPHGRQWRMEPGYPILMPGFSHGTAGVGYALLRAGRALARPDLVDVAVQAADTLIALGSTPAGWALPMTVPLRPDRPEVAFGWCHGPTGTVRLFAELAACSPDPRWDAAVDACLAAVIGSGLPTRTFPGFWDNVARCCGSAGVGSMLVDRYLVTGDAACLEFADVVAADVVARALAVDGGLAWSNTEHTAAVPDLPPEPGFLQGAAGIAGWLARLHAAHAGTGGRSAVPWV